MQGALKCPVPEAESGLFVIHPALVDLGMAGVAHGRNRPIVGLECFALAVSELVGVGRDDGPILDAADLAGKLPDGLKQFLVAIVQSEPLFLIRMRRPARAARRTRSWSSCWWRDPGPPSHR